MSPASPNLLDVLPGLPMPVEEVSATLAAMWDSRPEDPLDARISAFRASQMNLVLHFGLRTTPEEALALFDTAIEFAQRYPCRLIVLCPSDGERSGDKVLESKVFSQCYVGKTLRDMCCCEALILGYNTEDSRFLENQVSLWLETDLPIYHWFHRVPLERVKGCYASIVKRATRSIYDSDVDPALASPDSWPEDARTRDLAYARTLPMRQHIGQYLSVYPASSIAAGLKAVEVCCNASLRGEGASLLAWMRGALERCLEADKNGPSPKFYVCKNGCKCPEGLKVTWTYAAEDRYFFWEYNAKTRAGALSGQFGSGAFKQPLHIEPLPRPSALAEALFF